jgi:hypothetical protein
MLLGDGRYGRQIEGNTLQVGMPFSRFYAQQACRAADVAKILVR